MSTAYYDHLYKIKNTMFINLPTNVQNTSAKMHKKLVTLVPGVGEFYGQMIGMGKRILVLFELLVSFV